jgi:hypothetical protein
MVKGALYLKNDRKVVNGVLKGFKMNWNPLITQAYMQVKVGGEIMDVPIDRRQIRFVEKEYRIGDAVNLYYDGAWHIRSRAIDINENFVHKEQSVFV